MHRPPYFYHSILQRTYFPYMETVGRFWRALQKLDDLESDFTTLDVREDAFFSFLTNFISTAKWPSLRSIADLRMDCTLSSFVSNPDGSVLVSPVSDGGFLGLKVFPILFGLTAKRCAVWWAQGKASTRSRKRLSRGLFILRNTTTC